MSNRASFNKCTTPRFRFQISSFCSFLHKLLFSYMVVFAYISHKNIRKSVLNKFIKYFLRDFFIGHQKKKNFKMLKSSLCYVYVFSTFSNIWQDFKYFVFQDGSKLLFFATQVKKKEFWKVKYFVQNIFLFFE